MDEELRAYLDHMLLQINDQFERVLERITTMGADLRNTKSFLLEDAIVLGRRVTSIEERLDRLERGK